MLTYVIISPYELLVCSYCTCTVSESGQTPEIQMCQKQAIWILMAFFLSAESNNRVICSRAYCAWVGVDR